MSSLKTAAKAIHEAYESHLKTKKVSVTHKSEGDNTVIVSISGSPQTVENIYRDFASDGHGVLMAVQPERVVIRQASADAPHEGPKADKESDQTKILTIHHVITTY